MVRAEHIILFSALLLILASFLSYHYDTFTTTLTGFDVYSGQDPACPPNQRVLALTAPTNAHLAIPTINSSTYACLPWTGTTTCDGSNTLAYLTTPTNAHISQNNPNTSTSTPVCFQNTNCVWRTGSCQQGETCLASAASTTNAHSASCGTYPLSICCTQTSAGPNCPEGTTLCSDGTCQQNCNTNGGDLPCKGGTPNGICEAGEESCACTDCDGQQDSCAQGLTCQSGTCYNPNNDNDQDGISNLVDNCISIPNGPLLGTCVNTVTSQTSTSCLTNTDCDTTSGFTCSANQENTDAPDTGGSYPNGCGDVCDANNQDSCTCQTQDDVCIPPDDCGAALSAAFWGTSTNSLSVTEGTPVTLTVQARDASCDGNVVFFFVYDENGDASTITPAPVVFGSQKAIGNWNAEFTLPSTTSSQEWHFQTTIGSASISTDPNQPLSVTSDGTFCGDNTKDADEQCDGNDDTNCPGRCDTDCECINGGGGGAGCSNYCVPQTCICSSNTDVQCCGDFDGDGCNEYSTSISCSSGETCDNNFGSCVSSSCKAFTGTSCGGTNGWYCSSYSECKDGKMTRACIDCGVPTGCPKPLEEISCAEEQTTVKIPVFTWTNAIMLAFLLTIYYAFTLRRKQHIN